MSSSSLLEGVVDTLKSDALVTRQQTLVSSGPVRAVETASASGYSVTLVDSTGAGSTVPVVSVTGSGGPPITTANVGVTLGTLTMTVPTVNIDAAAPATTGLRISSSASSSAFSVTDSAAGGATLPVMTITSTGGPPINEAVLEMDVPIQHLANTAGFGVIPATASSHTVANTSITANSIILLTPQLEDLTCKYLHVVVNAGVSFDIVGDVAATADLPVNYFIARY